MHRLETWIGRSLRAAEFARPSVVAFLSHLGSITDTLFACFGGYNEIGKSPKLRLESVA